MLLINSIELTDDISTTLKVKKNSLIDISNAIKVIYICSEGSKKKIISTPIPCDINLYSKVISKFFSNNY